MSNACEQILKLQDQFSRQLNAVNKTGLEIMQLLTKEILNQSKPREHTIIQKH